MARCVAVLTGNKLRAQSVQKIIEGSNYECEVCENMQNFVTMFSRKCLDFYVLDVEDSQGNQVIEYKEFYNAFLKYVPNDMRVVIGDDEEFIKFDNFEKIFLEKVACRMLKGKTCSLISNDKMEYLTKQIERYLIERKFSPKYVGFNYVVSILCIYLTSGLSRIILSRDVYPKLYEEFNTSVYCIERNLRFFLLSNKHLGNLILDGNYSTKRIIEVLYRDLRKDAFIQKLIDDPDLKD